MRIEHEHEKTNKRAKKSARAVQIVYVSKKKKQINN